MSDGFFTDNMIAARDSSALAPCECPSTLPDDYARVSGRNYRRNGRMCCTSRPRAGVPSSCVSVSDTNSWYVGTSGGGEETIRETRLLSKSARYFRFSVPPTSRLSLP